MAELFATGRVVDGILALMLIEAAASVILSAKLRRGIPAALVLCNLAAGAALLLALRAAMMHSAWTVVAAWLAAALVAHVGELRLRWAKPAVTAT